MDLRRVPIIINCRDRVTDLVTLIAWLERAGHERIYLVDNDSTYPPLLDFYDTTPHKVIRLGRNVGHKAPWIAGVVEDVAAGGPYVVSDPDVVPGENCPLDAVKVFHDALQRFPSHVKAGFGLRIDDLSHRYRFRDSVRWWEKRFWEEELAPGLYDAGIDTTFALYRAGSPFRLVPGIRTGPPYVARHMAWYVDSDHPGDEERYYRRHARPDASFWEKSGQSDALSHERRVRRALEDLQTVLSRHGDVIVVDQDEWGVSGTLGGRRVHPFMEFNGQYWGPPSDATAAIAELSRLRDAGAEFLIVGWPAFWWLEYYVSFGHHVAEEYPCLFANDHLRVFDLRGRR